MLGLEWWQSLNASEQASWFQGWATVAAIALALGTQSTTKIIDVITERRNRKLRARVQAQKIYPMIVRYKATVAGLESRLEYIKNAGGTNIDELNEKILLPDIETLASLFTDLDSLGNDRAETLLAFVSWAREWNHIAPKYFIPSGDGEKNYVFAIEELLDVGMKSHINTLLIPLLTDAEAGLSFIVHAGEEIERPLPGP